ncbi:MAG TPA: alpha/beta fold hydrolase [Saprospiraceae bacterium]|nr:alpha/beta fold hydrolase [Saprospiraceae bacterium]HMP23796.1 alpha/beta fold hydrolase [Saprospiraceae bacterium]
MPHIHINGARLYYEDTEQGAETIVFAHSLLLSHKHFADQIAALRTKYRCIAFDFRGQGQSDVTADGYDMDTLTEDAAQLIQTLGVAPCHFVGLSMGGFVGQRLAIRYPQLLKSLTLLDTSADPEPPENLPKYKLLLFIARYFGLGLVANQVMPILFGQDFLQDPARKNLRHYWRKEIITNHRIGVTRAVRGVLTRAAVDAEALRKVTMPTLIIVGEQDVATVPAKSKKIQTLLPHARLEIIPKAGHIATVEAPLVVNQLLQKFFANLA